MRLEAIVAHFKGIRSNDDGTTLAAMATVRRNRDGSFSTYDSLRSDYAGLLL